MFKRTFDTFSLIQFYIFIFAVQNNLITVHKSAQNQFGALFNYSQVKTLHHNIIEEGYRMFHESTIVDIHNIAYLMVAP